MKPNQPWYISHLETIVQNVVEQLLYMVLMWALSIPVHKAIALQVGGFALGYARGYFIRRIFANSVAFKGATCYEMQIYSYWIRICYLRGNYWKWKPWRRIQVGIDRTFVTK